MICIYHNRDLDGWASGAIVKLKYPDCKLIGFDYGHQLPLDQIPVGEPIIMVDVALEDMNEMFELAGRNPLTWIDHHISSINTYYDRNILSVNDYNSITAVLENGISACEGTWRYLFPDLPTPQSIILLGKYDTWRNQDKYRWDNVILPFQFGMRSECNSPETFPVNLLTCNEGEEVLLLIDIIESGQAILKYQNQLNADLCKLLSFETHFGNLRAICLNGGGFNSDVFKSVYDESKHDIMILFVYDGTIKQWKFSLYTTKGEIDCSKIAKLYGGGGHVKAAGFQVNRIEQVLPGINYPPVKVSLY